MLGFEKTKDVLGCDSVSCAVEFGGALGVETLLYGSLAKLGKSYKFSDATLPIGPPLLGTHFAGTVVRFSEMKVEGL